MEINSVNTSFKAHVKTEQAKHYLNRLPYDEVMETIVMEMDNKHKKVDVFVSTVTKNGRERLKAEAGNKTFVENIFRGAVSTLRKATKFANKLEEQQDAERLLTKDMNVPKLG